MNDHRIRVLQGTGILCCVFSIILWTLWCFFNPYRTPTLGVAIYAVMVSLALLSVYFMLTRNIPLMFLAFAFSFFPIGLYTLGSPSIFAGIGLTQLGFLAAAIALRRTLGAADRADS